MTSHLLPPPDVPAPLTESATRAASVNASLTPLFRLAEHSKGDNCQPTSAPAA